MKFPLLSSLVLALGLTSAQATITLQSISSFDSDAEGWQRGAGTNRSSFNAGTSFDGQSGFLQTDSPAAGAGSRWLVQNTSSVWTGDYASAGVIGLSFYAENAGALNSTNPLRFALISGSTGFVSDAISLTNSSSAADWAQISLNFADFTRAAGSASLDDVLSNVTRVQFFLADNTPTRLGRQGIFVADQGAATINLDDIRAVGVVPEPSTSLLALLTLLGLSTRRRR